MLICRCDFILRADGCITVNAGASHVITVNAGASHVITVRVSANHLITVRVSANHFIINQKNVYISSKNIDFQIRK